MNPPSESLPLQYTFYVKNSEIRANPTMVNGIVMETMLREATTRLPRGILSSGIPDISLVPGAFAPQLGTSLMRLTLSRAKTGTKCNICWPAHEFIRYRVPRCPVSGCITPTLMAVTSRYLKNSTPNGGPPRPNLCVVQSSSQGLTLHMSRLGLRRANCICATQRRRRA